MTKRPDWWLAKWPTFEAGKYYNCISKTSVFKMYCVGYNPFGAPVMQYGKDLISWDYHAVSVRSYLDIVEYREPLKLVQYFPVIKGVDQTLYFAGSQTTLEAVKKCYKDHSGFLGVAKLDWSENQPFPEE